jgi:hypothetical protein
MRQRAESYPIDALGGTLMSHYFFRDFVFDRNVFGGGGRISAVGAALVKSHRRECHRLFRVFGESRDRAQDVADAFGFCRLEGGARVKPGRLTEIPGATVGAGRHDVTDLRFRRNPTS